MKRRVIRIAAKIARSEESFARVRDPERILRKANKLFDGDLVLADLPLEWECCGLERSLTEFQIRIDETGKLRPRRTDDNSLLLYGHVSPKFPGHILLSGAAIGERMRQRLTGIEEPGVVGLRPMFTLV